MPIKVEAFQRAYGFANPEDGMRYEVETDGVVQ